MKDSRRLTLFVFGLGLALVPVMATSQNIGERRESFHREDGSTVEVRILSASPNDVRLRVLHAATVVGDRSSSTSLFAIAGTPDLARPRKRERFLLSAGFSAYRTDVPVGLLISDGRLQSPVDASPPRAQAAVGCAAAARSKYRFSGLLCVGSESDTWKILPTADYKPGQCKEAVQSGPLLVEPGGEPGVCQDASRGSNVPYARLAACIDSAGGLHMVLTGPTSLYSFSQWLATGPLKCNVALNLSGAEEAGIVHLPSWRNLMPSRWGGVDAPLASALILETR